MLAFYHSFFDPVHTPLGKGLTASGDSPRIFWFITSVITLGNSSGASSPPLYSGFCLEDYGRDFVFTAKRDEQQTHSYAFV